MLCWGSLIFLTLAEPRVARTVAEAAWAESFAEGQFSLALLQNGPCIFSAAISTLSQSPPTFQDILILLYLKSLVIQLD